MSKYQKSCLIVFLTLIVLLSGCGEAETLVRKARTTPTYLNMTSPTASMRTVTPKPTVTPTSTPTPTQAPVTTLMNDGGYATLPPGSPLPGDAACAASIKRSSWEPRPDNTAANNTDLYTRGYRLTVNSDLSGYGYQWRVTGDFTGTTDEILQWGACKWGINIDIVRAQAVQESNWHQSELGDCRGGLAAGGCQSLGILQVKGADTPPTYPGTWPYASESTAFDVDYMLAILRSCYEGRETWLGNGYHAGDIWGCVGRWFSGDWYQSSQDYIASVQGFMASKKWLNPGF